MVMATLLAMAMATATVMVCDDKAFANKSRRHTTWGVVINGGASYHLIAVCCVLCVVCCMLCVVCHIETCSLSDFLFLFWCWWAKAFKSFQKLSKACFQKLSKAFESF